MEGLLIVWVMMVCRPDVDCRVMSTAHTSEEACLVDAAVIGNARCSLVMVDASKSVTVQKPEQAESGRRRQRAASQADVDQAIRQDCIRRQTMQHGLGGPAPNFALC